MRPAVKVRPEPSSAIPRDFRRPPSLGLLLAPFGLLMAIYLPTLLELAVDWYNDPNYSHGFLVPLVATYVIWTKRESLSGLAPSPSRAGLVPLILGLLMYILGTAGAEYFTARLSFVLSLFGLTWYLFGTQIVRKTWFAFFFLCFMIPIPYVLYYAIAFPMQLLATKITVGILSTLGMDLVRQGNVIHLADGHSLEVVEACSGIRSLVSLLALGVLFAYLTQKRVIGQIALFVATVPIAVAANVFRVLVTALLVATVGVEAGEEPMHTIMGLSVFIVSFLCLLILGTIFRKVVR